MSSSSISEPVVRSYAHAPSTLQLEISALEGATVPIAISHGDEHRIRYANRAFGRLFGVDASDLKQAAFPTFSAEPERVEALLDRVWMRRAPELAPDIGYRVAGAQQRFSSTLITPIASLSYDGLMIQILELPAATVTSTDGSDVARDLQQANEQLLLAGLRERELAERAMRSAGQVERLLGRTSILAEANALLSDSLDLDDTVRKVARLPVPDLAQACAVMLYADGKVDAFAIAHVDPACGEQLNALGMSLAEDPDLRAVSQEVRRLGKPFALAALAESPARRTLPGLAVQQTTLRDMGARGYLGVPLHARDTCVGLLVLITTKPQYFAQVDVEFTRELARRASVAVDNARLYREAQQAIAIREDVLAIVSHDLRSPLSSIMMSAERLLEVPEHRRSLDLIRTHGLVLRAAKHMRALIEEMLEFARVHTDRLTLESARIDLSLLIDDALEMMDPQAQQGSVTLRKAARDEPLYVCCDRERILRVFSNLIGNALKFTPKGGEIAVVVEQAGTEVTVSVQDHGPGIARDEMEKLFEAYWRGERTGRSGMGLGLYIARGIVQAHGGRIWIESTVGQGSAFRFTLPLSQ